MRDLRVGLVCGQRTHLFDDGCRRPAEIRCAERQRTIECGRCAALPANLHADGLTPRQGDILDEQPEHALAFARGCSWILPDPRQIGSKRVNARRGGVAERGPVLFGGPSILSFGLGELRQFLVPLPLELIRHQAVLRAHEQKLALGEFGLLVRPLDTGTAEPIDLGFAGAQLLKDFQGDLQ